MHLLRLLLVAALAAGLSSAAQAQTVQVVPACGAGDVNSPPGPGGQLVRDAAGNLCVAGPQASASPSGGLTNFRVMSAATTNPTLVKAGGGRLYAYTLCNTAGASRYVRFFNSASAPVPGTTAVYLGAILVAAGACQSYTNGVGLSFPIGIAYDITGAAGDADATAVAAGDVQGFLGYQ